MSYQGSSGDELKWNALEGEQEYVIPTTWDAGHVAKRLIDAYQTLRIMPASIGPRQFGTAWPAIIRELEEIQEAQRFAEKELSLPRPRFRPSADELALMEEALSWPMRYLPTDPLCADAVSMWACAKGGGPSIRHRLRARALKARAMVEKRRAVIHAERVRSAEIKAHETVIAWARREVEAMPVEERRARLPEINAIANRYLVQEEAELIEAIPPVIVHLVEVMPGKILSGGASMEFNLQIGLQLLAERLERARVPVR